MTMELDEFPKYEDVQKSIEKLKNTELPKYDGNIDIKSYVQSIEKIISNEFGILINYAQPIKHKDFKLKFFRARVVDEFQNPSLIREHSYPPINVTKMGRCNFPKLPVFYCSNDSGTALLEASRNKVGQNVKYYISKWELKGNEEDLIFQNFLQIALPEENEFKLLQKGFQNNINRPFRKSLNKELDIERTKGLIEYFKFLDSCFIGDDDYSISASLAYRALFVEHNYRADILMYPSVQTRRKGVNLALNPNFVENNLSMTRLYEVSLDNYDPISNKIRITFYKYAIIKKNVMFWKNITPDNIEYKNLLKEDFGDYE